jgi:acyl-CoA synthetase (AMP-forming)/AMP-acid ligase II
MTQTSSTQTSNSASSDETIDFNAMPTLGDIVRYHARRGAERTALDFEGRTTSWAALDRRSNQVANAFIAGGCRPGDRVAFVGKGTDEFFELLLGVAKAGLVLAPVQWRLALPEIQQTIRDAQPKYLFIGTDQFERIAELATTAPNMHVVTMEQGHGDLPRYATWRDAASAADSNIKVDPSAVALQLYTSGTTGLPKGVMLSHENILRGRREGLRVDMPWNEWLETDVNLVAMPVGHIGGVGWGIVGLFNGAKSIVQREFIPAQVLEAIGRHGVTKLFVVPTALHMLLLQPTVRQIDYSRLRYILYGASPIALDLLREATEVFGCGFCQQYGMTETCGSIAYLPPEDHTPQGNKRMRSAGLPLPGVEIRVVDVDRREPVAAGVVGEIETRSVANMVGYWNRATETTNTVNSEGWLRTGDAGYLDEDGYLYIHDRFKDMIVSGGENVYPAEVENAVYGHPAVQEVAVIGVPDERWGEAVKAIVVRKPGVAADADDIIAFARSRVAGFKVPKSVDFVEALPRGPSGKVLRRSLREPYWTGRERRVN